MPSWTSFESRVMSGRVEYFCKCSRQLTVQTAKTKKNQGKRFVTCSKCNVYDFLDDDLPSEYYKELLYEMFEKQKQLKKHMNYEQVINVLAMEKSMCEEELRATKSKLKLYDSQFYHGFLLLDKVNPLDLIWIKCLLANASCKCLLANASYKCKLQMQATNARCKCKMQMEAANACLQMQAANARCKQIT
ncbi:hypothetical protein Tco_1530730 [Tanacetum coccineum]